jgi:6-phosphogluconolactonase
VSAAASTLREEVIVAADAAEHAALAAELMARAIYGAATQRGVARVALSGGTTPAEAYRRLAKLDLPWESTEWFWVDERAARPDSPRSNYRNACADLGIPSAAVPPARVHRMEADDPDLEAAAARYEASLRRAFGVAAAVAFDVMTLGVGEDGHTASLFPGTGAALVNDRLVLPIAAQPSRSLEARLTLTAPVILEARLLLVLGRGASKRAVIEAAREGGDEEEMPARLVKRAQGQLVWLLDREAAPGA